MPTNQHSRSDLLLVVGFVLYAVAWFVPVFKGQDLVAALQGFGHGLGQGLGNVPATAQPPGGPDWLPGWQACEFSWRILIDEQTWSDQPSWQGEAGSWKAQAAGLSCLTNLVMLACGWLVFTRKRHPVLGLVMLAAAALDASWMYVIDKDPFTVLRVGYFLWVGSFAIVGTGLLLPAASSGRSLGRKV